MKYDVVIIGAGWCGLTVASELARKHGKKVLIVDRRPHSGGNCHDFIDNHGIRVHTYGPHLFHTDHEHVWNFVTQFGKWEPYEHKVQGMVDGKIVPIPFNLDTIEALFPAQLANTLQSKLINKFGMGAKVPILKLREEKDPELEYLASYIFDKVFKNYTAKQWGMSPDEIDPAVTARVPVVVSRDDRYFQDKYQALPANGYTSIFDNMLQHPNIHLMLGVESADIFELDNSNFKLFGQKFEGKVVYTGQIDELFKFEFGELAYRSLRFEYSRLDKEWHQGTTTVNYPNLNDFTRITEYKHISERPYPGKTLIMKEYPQEYVKNDPIKGVPYYPIFTDEHKNAFAKYEAKANSIPNLFLIGRLAEYKYYDQDDAIDRALKAVNDIVK